MTINTKQSSSSISTLASNTLQDATSSQIAKSLAASVLAQSNTDKQTGKELERKASQVLQSTKYSDETKSLAASVLSQSNKNR